MPLMFIGMPGPMEIVILLGLSMLVLPVIIVLVLLKSNSGLDKWKKLKSDSNPETNARPSATFSQRTPWDEGRAAGEARSIVRVLEYRFSQCPGPTCKMIYEIKDFERLDFLFQKAMSCQSPEEFEAAL